MSQKCDFSKIVLDRFSSSIYFWGTSAYIPVFRDLTEREEADLRHEDKSQDGTMPRLLGLAVCLFTRIW